MGTEEIHHNTHTHKRERKRERKEIEIKRCEESGHPDVNFVFYGMCHNIVGRTLSDFVLWG